MPDEGVLRERDKREPLAAETRRLADIVEERSGEEHIGIHLHPVDAAGKTERNLRGLEGMLRKAADICMVPAFCSGHFKEPLRGVHDPGYEGIDPRVFDLRGHAAKPPADALVIGGSVDKLGRIDRIPRHRGCEADEPVVHVDLTGTIEDLRVALDSVNFTDPDFTAE